MDAKTGRNNKSRGASYERDAAKILGGKRHKADTGGPEDIEHPLFSIQVKSRVNVADYIAEGLDQATAAGVTSNKPGLLVLYARGGTRLRKFAIMDLEAFADWNGFNAFYTRYTRMELEKENVSSDHYKDELDAIRYHFPLWADATHDEVIGGR